MFDLFRSRDKAVRILLGGILVLVSFSMLTYLIPSYNMGGANTADSVIAQVGKETITQYDVQRMVQNTMRGRQMPPEVLPNYVPQMINQMIDDRALAYEAERLGFQVTAADMSDAIRQMAPSLFPDGKFVGKEQYAALLAQQNMSIGDFEADLRRQLLITRLRNVAVEGSIVTPAEIEQEYQKKNTKVKLEYVKLTGDKYKKESEPSEQDMQNYYKANLVRYQEPEKKNLVILLADTARVEQTLNPADADLQRMYNQNQDQYRVPETVDVRHILLKTEGKPPADDAKIKAQAEDLLKQVRGGADFAALAKKYSEDPGSKDKGGVYEGVQHGQMVAEFDKACFTLKPGQSDLVKTQYGYHVIQVMAHHDARLKPFAEVKPELAAQWKKQRATDLLQQISDKAQGELQKDPAHPEKVAAEFNMQLVKADGVAAGRPVPEIGTSADFDQSIADLKKGQVSQPVALADSKIALAVVTDVIPPRPSTFDEVKNQVKEAIQQARMNKAVQDHAQELADLAKKDGDLAKAAKSMGLEVKTSDEFAESGTITGLGPASYFTTAFSSADGTVLKPIGIPDGTVVAKVIQHIPADLSKLPEQRSAIRDEIKSRKARDRNSVFSSGVRDELEREGKVKIHQDALQRLIASYRAS